MFKVKNIRLDPGESMRLYNISTHEYVTIYVTNDKHGKILVYYITERGLFRAESGVNFNWDDYIVIKSVNIMR